MRILLAIFSLFLLLSSTQPIWDAACNIMIGECGISLCEGPTCTPQEEDVPENPNRQCCPSFQCCFFVFGAFSTPYSLDFQELDQQNIRPSEKTKQLRSTYLSDCFRPPDVDFFT